MDFKKVIISGVTGFIGSNLAHRLAKEENINIIGVDRFGVAAKEINLEGIALEKIDRDDFPNWLIKNHSSVDFIFHLGARTDTTEFDFEVLDKLNLSFSKALWEICATYHIPLLYASSAATYGLGENGFDDSHDKINSLKPLNPYGLSKQLFDQYVLTQQQQPPFWVGLKFFNVYGPHEGHKGRMASVAYHAYKQVKDTGKLSLFKSHRADYKDGEQLRDFIYIDDVVNICMFFYKHRNHNGIYNVGTGQAHTFNELGTAIFNAMHIRQQLHYVPIPEDIRDKYQYFTEAKMDKLRRIGYTTPFTSLDDGIEKYVNYLGNK